MISKHYENIIKTPKNLWLKLLLLILGYIVIDFFTYNAGIAGVIFSIILLFSIIAMCFINIKWATLAIIPIFIFSDDISRVDPYADIYFGSILNIKLFSLPISHYLTFTLFGLLLASLIVRLIFKSNKKIKILPLNGKYMFLFLGLYLTMAIIGVQNLPAHLRYWINDLSPMFYTGTYFLLLLKAIKTPKDLNNMVWILLLSLAAKNTVWFFEYFMGIGYVFGDSFRVMFESGKALSILTLYIFAALAIKGHSTLLEKLFFFSILAFSFFNIFAFAGRGPWLFTFLGFIIFVSLLSYQKRIKVIVVGSILFFLIISTTYLLRPQAFKVFNYMAGTLATTFSGEISEFNHSSAIRILEAVNIGAKLKAKNALLIGQGCGSWFDFNYIRLPFPLTGGDYGAKEIANNQFHRPHNAFVNIFLKSGIIGLLFFIFIQVMFFVNSYKVAKITNDKYWKAIAIGIAASIPLILYNNWTTKMNMFIGIILAIGMKIYIFNVRKKEIKKDIK